MMHWSQAYVGIPYADLGRDRGGCDCYGLVRLIYEQELGIVLPDYLGTYASAGESGEVAALLGRASGGPCWRQVPEGRPFDLLAFRRGRFASTHLGLVVAPGRMLHVAGEDAAKIEAVTGRWLVRLAGIWRHAEAPSWGAQ